MENRTGLGNRPATLGYRIARCTTLGSLGLLDCNQLSRIKNSDSSTTPTVYPLGMHPKIWLHTVVTWQRPQTLNLKVIAEKRGK